MPSPETPRKLQCTSTGSFRVHSLPMHYVECLGWRPGDKISFYPKPSESALVMVNENRKPIEHLDFALCMGDKKYQQSPKKYRRELNENLSTHGRELLQNPKKWEDASLAISIDIGYERYRVQQAKLALKTCPKELKSTYAGIVSACEVHLKNCEDYVKKKKQEGGKSKGNKKKVPKKKDRK